MLAVVRKRLIVENRRGLLTQTHDQLDGEGITDITSLVNSVSKATLVPSLRQIKDSPECDGQSDNDFESSNSPRFAGYR